MAPPLNPWASASDTGVVNATQVTKRTMNSVTVLLALALAGCGFDAVGDQPMAAPDVYRTWWAKTEACSGLTGDFDRVQWEVVPGASFHCSSGQCAGHWESDHRIWIADQYLTNEMVVRHEMLHELLGHSGHPSPPFGEGCPLTWATWTGAD
jgi:hypothetical protein